MTNPFALPEQQPGQQQAPAMPAGGTAPVMSTATGQPVIHQQPVPTSQALAMPAGQDPFEGPAPARPRAPRLRDLYGRLLLIVPKKLESGIRSQFKDKDGNYQLQDRMTMDLVVLDGGTIHYGGRPEQVPSVPHNTTAEVPAQFLDVYDSHAGIISNCRDVLNKRLAGQGGMVLGRLTVGEAKGGNNPPYILEKPTDADKQVALAYLNSRDPFA